MNTEDINYEAADMEMPTPCQHCNNFFDLTDGITSTKWYPNTVICEKCAQEEDDEIERDDEIEIARNQFEDTLYDLRAAYNRLKELNAPDLPSPSIFI